MLCEVGQGWCNAAPSAKTQPSDPSGADVGLGSFVRSGNQGVCGAMNQAAALCMRPQKRMEGVRLLVLVTPATSWTPCVTSSTGWEHLQCCLSL